MFIVKVLKRKDAASVIVAVVIATLVGNSLASTYYWGNRLAHLGEANKFNNFPGQNWRDLYLTPFISLLLGIIVLEILVRLVICLHPYFVRKK